MNSVDDVLNHLNGQIAANQMIVTLAVTLAARNDKVAKNLADSIGNLSNQLDDNNHKQFNLGFQESIAKIKNIIAHSQFADGNVNLDIEDFKA